MSTLAEALKAVRAALEPIADGRYIVNQQAQANAIYALKVLDELDGQ